MRISRFCMFIACVLTISGCKYQAPNNTAQKVTKDVLCQTIEGLLSTNPNAANNEITKQDFIDKSNMTIDSLINEYKGKEFTIIENIPANFEMMLEYKTGANAGNYIVKFDVSGMLSGYRPSYDYDISFMIFSVVSKEVASQLVENKNYYLKCRLNDFVNAKNFTLPSGKKYEDLPSIMYYSGDKKWNFDLGTFLVEDLQFTEK